VTTPDYTTYIVIGCILGGLFLLVVGILVYLLFHWKTKLKEFRGRLEPRRKQKSEVCTSPSTNVLQCLRHRERLPKEAQECWGKWKK
jgi:hypothetical protein